MTDERLPVIWEKGVKTFGDEDMMKMMIQNFEPLSFDGVMKDLAAEFQTENWLEVKRHAHTMKGSSSYIGADRFSEVCLVLQNAAMGTNVPEIYEAYDKVLKEGKILKNHLAKLLEKTPDTTEIDSYISALEKLKKTKKVTSNKPKPPENNKDIDEAKKKAAIASKKDQKKIEENKETTQPLNIEKNNKKEKENGPTNGKKPVEQTGGGILESGEASADKACCKQCCIF